MSKLLKNEKGRLVIGLIALIVAAAVCVALPTVRLDWTKQKVATPDAQAEALIESLDTPVDIYYIANGEETDLWMSELLRRYDGLSDNLTVTTVAPDSPAVQPLNRYANGEALAEGSMIVASDKRSAVLSTNDMLSVDYDMNAYYYYQQYVPTRMDYTAQTTLYNAINYVSRDDMAAVYFVTGHGGNGLDGMVHKVMRTNNIDLRELDLASAQAVPEDATMLIVSGLETPLSEDECAVLGGWLENGGKLLLLTDYTSDLTNLSELTAHYGLAQKPGMVLDSDTKHVYSADYKYFLKPDMLDADLTADVKALGAPVIVPMASALTRSNERRDGLNFQVLLTTSAQAYIKADTEHVATLDQEDADEFGKFVVAMAASEGDTRLVWFASTAAFAATAEQASGGANSLLLNNLLAKLSAPSEGVTLNAPSLLAESVALPKVPALIGLLILPLALAIVAIVRKKKS